MGLVIRQPERGYRFSIDSVILAGFAAPLCRGTVLDLGTGCGVLLLLLSRLAPGIVSRDRRGSPGGPARFRAPEFPR